MFWIGHQISKILPNRKNLVANEKKTRMRHKGKFFTLKLNCKILSDSGLPRLLLKFVKINAKMG